MTSRGKEQHYFGRGSKPIELEVARAKGSLIWDVEGKKYIDFLGGSGVGCLGWGHPEVEMRMRNADIPTYVYPNFRYKRWGDLAEKLALITPKHLTTSFRTTGGSEAVEAAMQVAMMYTGRKKFLSVEGSYHGNTIGAISLSSSDNQKKFSNLLPGCEKIDPPLDQNALDHIEDLLKNNEFAAFIMEPIICNLGVIIPSEGFMRTLDKLCKSHGTLLVMDEAISGFGRTGKLFGTEHYDIQPDMMILDKAISGGYAGIGALIVTDKIASVVNEKVGLYSTFGWHPLGVEAAIAVVDILLNDTEDLFTNIDTISSLFRRELEQLEFKQEPEIRIKGLAIGIDVQDQEYAEEIKQRGVEKGLLMNTEKSSLTFFPALNIERDIVVEGLNVLKGLI